VALVSGRVIVALGGNAIAPAHTGGTAEQQLDNIARAMRLVADLVEGGFEVVLTHGNGPQVGNLMIKNELARDVVPAMPLDWCVAQTQATIGSAIATALEAELNERGRPTPVAPVISRVLVDADDAAFDEPTKPIGPFVDDEEKVRSHIAEGQAWRRIDGRGWRRVVPSPEPLALLDLAVVRLLLEGGAVVVAAGGGGIPMARGAGGRLRGVEAGIDKDLAGAPPAREGRGERFAILTDVAGVAVGYGTDEERWLSQVTVADLRALQGKGEFAAGSMGPKVEALCRFVEATGGAGAIGSLEEVADTVRGHVGTQVRLT
jgi:carbamate kinase